MSITLKYLREQVREAIGMPAKQSKVRRLNFCEWVEAANPWIEPELWAACEFDEKLDSLIDRLKGATCYGGLDLSGKNDLTALTLVFPQDDGRFIALTWFWTPNDTILIREDRDRVPYATWRDQGFLEATPGRSIDYAFVAKKIGDAAALFALQELAYDRYRIDDLIRELGEAGIECHKDGEKGFGLRLVPHGQGFVDMAPAVDALETAVLNGQLAVHKNPVMTMCAANAVLTQDAAGNRKFDKRPGKSSGRIDGVVSLAMAMRRAAAAIVGVGPSVYETRGILMV